MNDFENEYATEFDLSLYDLFRICEVNREGLMRESIRDVISDWLTNVLNDKIAGAIVWLLIIPIKGGSRPNIVDDPSREESNYLMCEACQKFALFIFCK